MQPHQIFNDARYHTSRAVLLATMACTEIVRAGNVLEGHGMFTDDVSEGFVAVSDGLESGIDACRLLDDTLNGLVIDAALKAALMGL